MFKRSIFALSVSALVCAAVPAGAEKPPTFEAQIMNAAGTQIGFARFVGVGTGVQVTVDVHGLPPGQHGLHVHEFGSCNAVRDTQGVATAFGAAGAHFDPAMTKAHKGPDGGGHAGDLPNLNVDDAGNARLAFFDPALSTGGATSVIGRAIVIHAAPDNYTDTPPAGGSGGRIACGEINALRG